MNYTPGPWNIEKWGNKLEGKFMGQIVSANGTTVYDGPFNFHSLGGKTQKESDATAQLISAAPELLEACQDILVRIKRCQFLRLDTLELEQVIQKATQCSK